MHDTCSSLLLRTYLFGLQSMVDGRPGVLGASVQQLVGLDPSHANVTATTPLHRTAVETASGVTWNTPSVALNHAPIVGFYLVRHMATVVGPISS